MIDQWYYAFRRDEPEYMKTVASMGKRATCESAEVLAGLVGEMLDSPADLLGKLYQAYSANDKKRLAQYFTPDSAASAMAQMGLVGMRRENFVKIGGAVIGEPTIGSGVMAIHGLLAVDAMFGEWGTSRTHIVGNDIDLICCKMAALQLLWLSNRFPIGRVTITNGDGLRPETQRALCWFGSGLPTYARRIRRTL
jgi:hypothetical protein